MTGRGSKIFTELIELGREGIEELGRWVAMGIVLSRVGAECSQILLGLCSELWVGISFIFILGWLESVRSLPVEGGGGELLELKSGSEMGRWLGGDEDSASEVTKDGGCWLCCGV